MTSTVYISSRDDLKEEIKLQIRDDIKDNFDFGYIQGSNLISVRSSQDISEIWNCINKGKEVTLWCDGLNDSTSSKPRKGKHIEVDLDEYSDDDSTRTMQKKSKKEQQEEKLEEIVTELKGKHGKNYTTMQYRIWGEMVGTPV